MPSAVSEALEHLEKQAVKYKTRWRTKKRHNHKSANPKNQSSRTAVAENGTAEAPQEADRSRRRPLRTNFDRRCGAQVSCGRHEPPKFTSCAPRTPSPCAHDPRRSHQGSPLPRSRRLRLPRSQRQSDGAAPHPRRKNGIDRSAVKSAISYQPGSCADSRPRAVQPSKARQPPLDIAYKTPCEGV